jgi:hypothetical protein
VTLDPRGAVDQRGHREDGPHQAAPGKLSSL